MSSWVGMLHHGSSLNAELEEKAEKLIVDDINSGKLLLQYSAEEPAQFALLNEQVQKLATAFSASASGLPAADAQKKLDAPAGTIRSLNM